MNLITVLSRIKNRYYSKHFFFKMEDLDAYSEAKETSKINLAFDYIKNMFRYGIDFSEYIVYDFYPKSKEEKESYLTRMNKFKIYPYFNQNEEVKNIYNYKNLFNENFNHFLERNWIHCKDEKEVMSFVEQHSHFIWKPLNLHGGEGIKIIQRSSIHDSHAFAKKAVEENVLLEEIIQQHSDLAKLNSSSVNTIRFVTVLTANKVHHISAILRVGKKGHYVDNVSQGGIMYPIDLETGKIKHSGIDKSGKQYQFHPHTNIDMRKYQIPE